MSKSVIPRYTPPKKIREESEIKTKIKQFKQNQRTINKELKLKKEN